LTNSTRAGEKLPWPVLFLGHGSPMNAIKNNAYSKNWRTLGEQIGKPKSVLCVSAHWLTEGTQVTANENPKTIHDFGGFPGDLYQVQYPAPGNPTLARHVAELLELKINGLTDEWGLDHGAWSVLKHLYPDADVPVVQLSLDVNKSASAHVAMAKKLAPLRKDGVLILASGNVVHNLGLMNWAEDAPVPEWARRFDQTVVESIQSDNLDSLIHWETLTPEGARAHPSPDHYWPLLYAMALREKTDQVSFPVTGFQHGSISMRAVIVGSSER
jgi:4,5-DOPA dioxygenase extradiol